MYVYARARVAHIAATVKHAHAAASAVMARRAQGARSENGHTSQMWDLEHSRGAKKQSRSAGAPRRVAASNMRQPTEGRSAVVIAINLHCASARYRHREVMRGNRLNKAR